MLYPIIMTLLMKREEEVNVLFRYDHDASRRISSFAIAVDFNEKQRLLLLFAVDDKVRPKILAGT